MSKHAKIFVVGGIIILVGLVILLVGMGIGSCEGDTDYYRHCRTVCVSEGD